MALISNSYGAGSSAAYDTPFTYGSASTSARPPTVGNPQSLTDQYKLYNTAVQQNSGDYSSIMQGYKDLAAKAPSSAFTSAVTNLGNLATTGGYSDADKADIRARGVSPIRSIYSSANDNLSRQRALDGGYSPNYNASQVKMARDMSEKVGEANTNVNATLAQNIAGNRVNTAGAYADAAGRENSNAIAGLQGQTSLYGTTPAMSSTFGNQALQGSQIQAGVNNNNQQANTQLMDTLLRRF